MRLPVFITGVYGKCAKVYSNTPLSLDQMIQMLIEERLCTYQNCCNLVAEHTNPNLNIYEFTFS